MTTVAAQPHAPSTGRMRRLLGRFYFTGVFWYRLHLFGMRVLPEWAMRPVVGTFTALFLTTLPQIRRALGKNSELVLGPCGWFERQRRAWRTLNTFSWCLSERYEQFVPGKQSTSSIDRPERWDRLLEDEKGFIVVTAHVGNWEMGSALPALREDRTVNLVREGEIDPESQRFVEELLAKLGGPRYRTHFAADDPALGVALFEALERGEIAALQCDRPRAGGRSDEVELFGRPFPMPVGPAVLARSSGVPLVPMFFLRDGRRSYRIRLAEPFHVARTKDRAADVREALMRMASEVEAAVRAEPHQWFCFAPL